MDASRWVVEWQKARRTYSESDFGEPDPDHADALVGQDRAQRAIEFGLAMGAHLFLVGPTGTGKRTYIRNRLEKWAAARPTPEDWCYVPRFGRENEPQAIALSAGKGRQFQREVEDFVRSLYKSLRDVFESEAYAHHRQGLLGEFETRQQNMWRELSEQARTLGFGIQTAPTGQVLTLPLKPDGQPFRPQEFQELPDSIKANIQKRQKKLEEPLELILHRIRALDREARTALAAMDQETAENTAGHLLETAVRAYQGTAAADYFQGILHDSLRHLDDLRREDTDDAGVWVSRYAVQVIVEHEPDSGAPVIFESNPSFAKLFGQINYMQVQGMLVASLQGIVAGSILKANGGFLVMSAEELLQEPYAYSALKRVLREASVKVENAPEAMNWMRPTIFQPEPIALDLTIVLMGQPATYYALYNYDPDFRRLFTVKADFAADMAATAVNINHLAHTVSTARIKGRGPSGGAVAALLELAAELAEDQDRLSTRIGELLAVLKESEVWAEAENSTLIERRHVLSALMARRERSQGPSDLMHRLIADGTLLIQTEGYVVGQVNGLAVMSAGDAPFGHPSRITASVWAGERGIVNIERQTRQSGTTHSKGVLTLSGFFSGRFGSEHPLSLSASIGFEQMYDEVDGDSASSAELYALISAMAGIGINQGIAVTGSVDQYGAIQPIGGVNHKIEGFFRTCQSRGLTGHEGVMIPARNLRHLMVSTEVQQALEQGVFHLWAVDTIDEGIEVLTGVPAGRASDGPDTVMGKVAERLDLFAALVQKRHNG
ncbi:MAG: peptidase S16 [Sulfobacillus acidophilus]|uniref:endopeptidase La n=1 Tax=Sulfobacillus acidophilus TaxID=53633 RepID=A0A2T2WHT6_9FIRM|nr:MAG: peptidase S16 [Sulfobacillus acidophilus]